MIEQHWTGKDRVLETVLKREKMGKKGKGTMWGTR